MWRAPVATVNTVTSTELQQSIFNAPPSSNIPANPVPTTSHKPVEVATNGANVDGEGRQGVKRRREDESDDEEAPMEEDDDDVSMEASSDDE